MRNLQFYEGEPFDVHKKAVNQKHNSARKEKLKELNPIVEKEYKCYSDAFSKKDLSVLSPCNVLKESKDDLQSLYKYSNKTLTDFRKDLKTLQPRTILATCQCCTIKQHDTLDHILPQEKFPEFVVNPINLIPTCSTCNGYKYDIVSDNNNPRFLNLYFDQLPKIQYLFVNISYDEIGELDYHFYLKNINLLVDSELFNNLMYHYEKLHLCERFKLASIEHESEFETTFSSFIGSISIQDIATILKSAAIRNQEAYGHNHWQAILELTLLDNPIFLDKMKKLEIPEITSPYR